MTHPLYRIVICTKPGMRLGYCEAFVGDEPPEGYIWCEGGEIPDEYRELGALLRSKGFDRLPDFRAHIDVSNVRS